LAILIGYGYIALIEFKIIAIPTVVVVGAVRDARVMHYLAHFVQCIGFAVETCTGNFSLKSVVLSRAGAGNEGTDGCVLSERVWEMGNLLPRRGCA